MICRHTQTIHKNRLLLFLVEHPSWWRWRQLINWQQQKQQCDEESKKSITNLLIFDYVFCALALPFFWDFSGNDELLTWALLRSLTINFKSLLFFEKWFKKEKCHSLNMASTSCDISSFIYIFMSVTKRDAIRLDFLCNDDLK